MANEIHDKFVKDMLEKSKKTEEAKPQNSTQGVDVNNVEQITQQIRDRLQKKRY
jgi:hypothetical protein